MAIRAYISTVVSSIKAAENRDGRGSESRFRRRRGDADSSSEGRRALLLSTVAAATAAAPQVNDSKTKLLQNYLKKSEENKSKNDKERLDSYYKRNYMDYFGFQEGTLKAKKEPLTETEKGILDWLQANK